MPDQRTVIDRQADMLQVLHEAFTKQLADSVGFVCYADIWSSNQSYSFLGVNLEFCNSNMVRVRYTCDMIEMVERHTAAHLRDELTSCIRRTRQEAGPARPPLICLLTDNASNVNNMAISEADLLESDDDDLVTPLPVSENLLPDYNEPPKDGMIPTLVEGYPGKWYGDSCHSLSLAFKTPLQQSR